MQQNSSKAYSAMAVVLTILLFVISWKLILPGYSGSKAKISQLDQEINQATAKKEQLDNARSSLASIETAYKSVTVSVAEDSDEPNLISELEAIAIKNGIILPSISISSGASSPATDGSVVSAAPGTPIGVAISVSGTYDQLGAFIASLEKSVKFMDIQSLSYSKGEGENVSLSLTLNAYSRLAVDTATPEAATN